MSDGVKQLCEDLIDDPVHNVNIVVKLIRLFSSDDEGEALEAVQTLRIYFVDALHSNVAGADTSTDDAGGKLLEFVKVKFEQYTDSLLALFQSSSSEKVQLAAMMALMEALRSEKIGTFNSSMFARLLSAVLGSKRVPSAVVSALVATCTPYADCRFFLMKWLASASTRLLEQAPNSAEEWEAAREDMVLTIFDCLCATPDTVDAAAASWCGAAEAGTVHAAPLPHEGSKARKKRKLQEGSVAPNSMPRVLWASGKAQRQAYSDAWATFLQLPLPKHVYKRLLQRLTTSVLPNLRNPLLLSDFLTRSIDQGGLVGVLSLHGLFILVTQHGFEYPQFYRRLYSLLTPQAFTARHRLKFLQLADVFLASSLVPAYTVAAFAKRFARIALVAPPMAAIVCIAFVHNLLRRHPSCTCLLHQPASQAAADGVGAGVDVYDAAAEDPAESGAIESSLWELAALKAHQCPMVSQFAQQLDKDLTDKKKTGEVDMAPLLQEGYSSQIAHELEKKLRKAPATRFFAPAEAPKSLFDAGLPGWEA